MRDLPPARGACRVDTGGGAVLRPLVLFLVLLLGLVHSGPSAADQWALRYTGGDGVTALDAIPTSDCGWLIVGNTIELLPSSQKWDAWVMKLDSAGAVQWSRAFGGEAEDPWIVKLDLAGNLEWQIAYQRGRAADIAGPTADGGVLVSGLLQLDLWLIHLGPGGEEIWQRRIGGPQGDCGVDLERTSDGGFISAGVRDSPMTGLDDLWVVKLDPAGEIEWQRAYATSEREHRTYGRQTADGGYVCRRPPARRRRGGDLADAHRRLE